MDTEITAIALDGEKGEDGIDGLSTYAIALENGFNGRSGGLVNSLLREEEAPGLPGSQDEKGDPGEEANMNPQELIVENLIGLYLHTDNRTDGRDALLKELLKTQNQLQEKITQKEQRMIQQKEKQ